MRISILIVTVIAIVSGFAIAQDISNIKPLKPRPSVEFYQEEITFIINDSIARVEGVYHFRNNTGKEFAMPVMFPFYVDSVTGYPDYIEAFQADSAGNITPLDFIEMPERGSIRMRIPITTAQETVWHLNYEQRISAKKAVYIITTTAAWQKPLEQATYTFVVPASFKNVKVWPEPDTTFAKDNQIYRQCVKYQFMPAREMEISWR
jgi:hypothetical protein